MEEIKDTLAKESRPQCRIRYVGDKAQIMIGNRPYEPIIYMGSGHWSFDKSAFREKIEAFRNSGIHLYGIGISMNNIWRPDGSLDLESVDSLLLRALILDTEGCFLFSISTSIQPDWWNKSHPNELINYANGGVDLTTTSGTPGTTIP